MDLIVIGLLLGFLIVLSIGLLLYELSKEKNHGCNGCSHQHQSKTSSEEHICICNKDKKEV